MPTKYLIDEEYFIYTFEGTPPEDYNELDRLIQKASIAVETLVSYKVTANNIEQLREPLKGIVKRAVCVLVEHYDFNDVFTKKEDSLKSAGIGSFNYTENEGSYTPESIPPSVINILMPTGLLYGGLNVVSRGDY